MPSLSRPPTGVGPLCVIAACLLLSAADGSAQQAGDLAETPLEKLGSVQVYSASKRLQTLTEAPSFVTVITGDQIRKFGYRTLGEVLQSVAGFYTDYDRNYTYVGVRGFSRPGDYNSRILVLLDGHRMNENIYDGGYVGTEFPLNLALVSRIEIARGPSAALYGANAFFAVVNVVTQPPELRHGVELSFDAASYGTYGGTVTIGTRRGALTHLLVSGTAYESAGPSPLYFSQFATPANNHGLAENADGDTAHAVLATVTRSRWHGQFFYSDRTKGIPTGAFETLFNDPRNRTLDRRSYVDLEYSRPLSERWQVSARGYFDHYDYKGTYIYGTEAGSSEVQVERAFGDWSGANLSAVMTGWKRHAVTFGSEFRINLRQALSTTRVDNPDGAFRDHRDSSNWAFYAQDEFTIAKPFVVYAGIRYDRYSQFGGTTNPRLGGVYRPWFNTAFKLIYGTAFRAPNSWELYYNALGYSRNPALDPEKVRTWELIVEHTFAGWVRASASAFHNRISQLINQTVEPDGNLMFHNLGSVSAKGLEAQVEARRGEYELRTSYTFQLTHDPATGGGLSNSPKHLAKLNFIAPLRPGRLFAAIEAQCTSLRFTNENERVGGFTAINLTAFAPHLKRNLDLSFSVFNLFDRRYAAVESDPSIAPVTQDGRSLRLKLTYRF